MQVMKAVSAGTNLCNLIEQSNLKQTVHADKKEIS